jgi:hypothetical protein
LVKKQVFLERAEIILAQQICRRTVYICVMSIRRITALLFLAASCVLIHAADAARKSSSERFTPLMDPPGMHNLYGLGTNFYSGSSPDTEEAFAALAKLGIKTILSVDGSKPNVALAKKFGMTYVHLPHGYDGISTNLQLQLAKAGQTLPRPVYIHCHHGKHRGPAAAAVICMSNAGWSAQQAEDWLVAAGTATNYAGLYQSIRNFIPPAPGQLSLLPGDFPETAQVSRLVDLMVAIDLRWEHLKAARTANYGAPADHPDLHPANESVILWETYREAQRLPEASKHGDEFIARLQAAEEQVRAAETLLRSYADKPGPDLRAKLDQSFDAMARACSSCHKAYRDSAGASQTPSQSRNQAVFK